MIVLNKNTLISKFRLIIKKIGYLKCSKMVFVKNLEIGVQRRLFSYLFIMFVVQLYVTCVRLQKQAIHSSDSEKGMQLSAADCHRSKLLVTIQTDRREIL